MLKTSQNLNAQEDKINNKSIDPLFNKLPDYVSCMWELPQIFEFLCFAKETLHIEHLSMYEMERMLTMPKASKQLANIMTCLLGPSVPRSRLMKIPAMPYEFWTSVLLKQKAAYWIKVYENKEHDSVKVLDTIGVEPEFWTLFPDTSIISHCDFEDFNLRQRVWLLKTLCDTMMHGKKSLQDEVTNRYLDGEGEKILGRDRYGSRYICFPIFHNNDLRIYKFSLNNKVLSNVAPIISKSKIHTRHLNNRRDRWRKKSRWKNGNLPQKQKKRIVKVIQVKKNELQCDIKVEVGEECSNVTSEINLNTIVETQKTNMKIEKEEEEEKATSVGETEKLLENKDEEIHVEEKDVQVMSPSLTSKLSDVEKNDGQPYPDNVCNSLKTDDEKINEIKTITSSSNNIVCPLTMNSGVISKSDDEKIIATKIVVDNDDDDDDDGDDDKKKTNNTGNLNDENCLNPQIKTSIDTDDSKDNIKECKNTNLNCTQTESKIEIKNLNNILKDLSVTSFQLIADDMISLKELISTLSMQNSIHKAEPVRCEMLLIKKLKNLMYSLRSKEHLLMDAATIARVKLEHEWMNFQKGIDDDDDVSKCARYSSKWVLGSQGCPLLSCRETVQSDEIESVHDKSESEKNDDDEDENVPEKKTETRRVLRARGVSSYMEQFSSDDDTDSSHPEGWAEIVDPTTGIHLGMPSAQPDGAEEDDVESAGSGSDQDWILPGKRKRKSKRISPGKRLKSFQHKVQTIKEELKNNESTPILDVENKQKNICSKNSLSEIRIQSVHSEFHIKDEISAIESSTTNTQTIVNDNNLQQNYVIHQVNTPNGPMNYVVLPNDNPPIAQTSAMVSVMPQVPVQPGYYMQNPQGYFISNPQLTQVQSPYVDEQNLQSMHGVIIQPNNQSYATPPNNYLQYQQIRMAPSVSMYPTSVQSSIMNPPINFPTQITKVQPRIIQDRQIVPPYRPRHPVGAVIRSTVPFKAVIRLPSSGRGRGSKVVQQNPKASPNIRSSRINTEKNTKQRDTTKTTSLIVLSDSDDEIEMIIPQKNNKIEPKRVQNKNLTTSQTKIINNNNKNNSNNNNNNNNSSSSNNNNSDNSSVTLSASNNHQSSSQCILTPQIIQRMSQGGISITPIKPKIPKKSSSISATQLVVVVNETGSHYALALPNGSKLILTPEQVAQIRASNGGKLAL